MRNSLAKIALIGLLGSFVLGNESAARTWKPDDASQARDYAIINHTAADHKQIRMLFWIPPVMVPSPAAKDLLDKYLLLGVAQARINPTGTFTFDTIETIRPTDGTDTPLKLLGGDDIPPTVAGAVATMTSVFGQSLGAFGKGFHWFVFEPGAVHACEPGMLKIPFEDEVYTYETPIPGCPKK